MLSMLAMGSAVYLLFLFLFEIKPGSVTIWSEHQRQRQRQRQRLRLRCRRVLFRFVCGRDMWQDFEVRHVLKRAQLSVG